jgi:predicted nucleotidyltransferase
LRAPQETLDRTEWSRLRAAGLRAAADIARDNPVDEMYLSGSIYGGLGTSTSDIDLYVVTDMGVEDMAVQDRAGGTTKDVVHAMVDGVVVDVEVRAPGRLDDVTRRFARYRYELDGSDQVSYHPWDLVDAVRLHLGEPIGASPLVRRLRSRLDADELRRLVITHYAARCTHLSRDLGGQWQRGDTRTLAYLAHNLLNLALEAFAAGCGELYMGEKWTWVKLARRIDEPHRSQLERLFFAGVDEPDDGSLEALARRRILAAQSALCAALLDGWDEAGASRWQAWPGDVAPAPKGCLRSPHWLPLRTTDEVLLGSYEEALSFSPDGLRLWGACVGTDRGKIVEEMLRFLERAGRPSERHDVEDYLTGLRELGALGADSVELPVSGRG